MGPSQAVHARAPPPPPHELHTVSVRPRGGGYQDGKPRARTCTHVHTLSGHSRAEGHAGQLLERYTVYGCGWEAPMGSCGCVQASVGIGFRGVAPAIPPASSARTAARLRVHRTHARMSKAPFHFSAIELSPLGMHACTARMHAAIDRRTIKLSTALLLSRRCAVERRTAPKWHGLMC